MARSTLRSFTLALLVAAGTSISAFAHAERDKRSPSVSVPADSIPHGQTPVSGLSTSSHEHHEVLRIGRDFGKDHLIIVLDGWVRRAAPSDLTEVRLWWINARHDDRRGPFSNRTMSHFTIEYQRIDARTWAIMLHSDDKHFKFRVVFEAGSVRAYTTVVSASGLRIPRCRTLAGELRAKRFLGIPTGIEALIVTCIDPAGRRHTAPVVTDGRL